MSAIKAITFKPAAKRMFSLSAPAPCIGCGDPIYNDEQGTPFWWSDGSACDRGYACHPCATENKNIGGTPA
jgi:hypothetical protein